jgi:hypothetical protein
MDLQLIASWHPLAVALCGVAYFAALYVAAALIAGAERL